MTLLELLVAVTVTLLLMGAALAMAMSGRHMFTVDQNRTTLNQNVRAGIDLVGIDLRQAGERLPSDLPAIEIADGASGAPDTLTLRRNLLDHVLPVCQDITSGSTAADVAIAVSTGTIPQGCNPVLDANTDGWPDNLEGWRSYRTGHAGQVRVYIYNPTTSQGEWFVYDTEDSGNLTIHRGDGDPWQYDYATNDQARIYIMEQRDYQLNGDVLTCVLDGDSGNVLNIVSTIANFQTMAVFQDGSTQASLDSTDRWPDLRAIEVSLTGENTFQDRTLARTQTTRFFPRNVLSRR